MSKNKVVRAKMDWDEYFMRNAYLIAEKSKDPRTHIGTVLVRDKNIISSGYNSFPMGVKDLESRYQDRETKYDFVAHSEFNAVVFAARLGVSTLGSVCYSFGVPCETCSKALIQGGVKEIICHRQWPNLFHSEKWVKSVRVSKQMFRETGVKIRWFDKKLGIKGFLDGKEIDV